MENKKFIFNKYKTSDTYGRQEISIPDELCSILNSYIRSYKIKDKLFPDLHESYELTHALTVIFQNAFNKYISVNILRHSFITHLEETGEFKILQKRKEIAYQMGHSVSEQLKYCKNTPIVPIENTPIVPVINTMPDKYIQ